MLIEKPRIIANIRKTSPKLLTKNLYSLNKVDSGLKIIKGRRSKTSDIRIIVVDV